MIYTVKHKEVSYSIVLCKIETIVLEQDDCVKDKYVLTITCSKTTVLYGEIDTLLSIKGDILAKLEDIY